MADGKRTKTAVFESIRWVDDGFTIRKTQPQFTLVVVPICSTALSPDADTDAKFDPTVSPPSS